MAETSYYSQIPKIAYPILSNLIQGNTLNSGNIGLGGIGGTLASFVNPKLAPVGSYIGGTVGTALRGGQSLGQSLTGGLPSLGVSLLSQLIPGEYRQAATPVLNQLANIILGASPTMVLGGGILSSLLNLYSDLSGEHKMRQAERKANKRYLSTYQANPWADPIWNEISKYLPSEIQSMTGENAPRVEGGAFQVLSKAFPTWLQDMLYGLGPLTHAPTAQQMGLNLSLSPLLRTFTPELTQQALGGLQKYLQNPEGYDFSGWSSLPQGTRDKLYQQLIQRQGKDEGPAPLLAGDEWNQLSKLAGTKLDPFTIMGGLYKNLEDLEAMDTQVNRPVGRFGQAEWSSMPYIYQGIENVPKVPDIESFKVLQNLLSGSNQYRTINPVMGEVQPFSQLFSKQELITDPTGKSYYTNIPQTYQNIAAGKFDRDPRNPQPSIFGEPVYDFSSLLGSGP